MNRVFLVTAVGGDIGSSVARHIKECYKEDKVIGCDIEGDNQGGDYLNESFVTPQYTNKVEYWKSITDICIKRGVTHFLPITEPEMVIVDREREFFDKNNIKLLLLSHNLLDIVFSKYKTAMFLDKRGIKVPKTWREGEEHDAQFPLIVKEERAFAMKTVRVVNTKQELQQATEEIPQPVIQEYVGSDDDEYTMTVFSDGTHIETIAFKRRLDYGGMNLYVEYIKEDALISIAKALARELQFIGSINVQLRRQNQVFYVVEINPGFSGTIGFRYKLGFTDDIWWLRLLDGGEAGISFIAPKKPAVGIKVLDERIYKAIFEIKLGWDGWYFLLPATLNDSTLLLEWVNEKECRSNSFHEHNISMDEHEKWFFDICNSNNKAVFILWEGEMPIAQVREEIDAQKIRLSYSVSTERRGCGFGKMLLQMYEWTRSGTVDYRQYLYGQVKKNNVASQHVFEELGYEKKEIEDIYIYYKSSGDIHLDIKVPDITALIRGGGDDIA